ncbi:MAG: hypothetical protein RXN93_08110 [Thermocladium sp.]
MKDEFFDFEGEEDSTQPTQPSSQPTQTQAQPSQAQPAQSQSHKLVKVVFIRQLLPNVSRARRSKYSTEDGGNIVINQVIDRVQWKAIMSVRNHALAWLHRNAVNTPWGWIYFSNAGSDVKEEKAMLEQIYTRIVREMGREARQDVLTAINRSLPYMEAYLTIEQARRIFNDVLAVEEGKVKRITEKMRSGKLMSRQYIKLLKKKEELEVIIGKIQDLLKGL